MLIDYFSKTVHLRSLTGFWISLFQTSFLENLHYTWHGVTLQQSDWFLETGLQSFLSGAPIRDKDFTQNIVSKTAVPRFSTK